MKESFLKLYCNVKGKKNQNRMCFGLHKTNVFIVKNNSGYV